LVSHPESPKRQSGAGGPYKPSALRSYTFASLMIAAGVNAKALSTYMGHANISTRSTATGT
jgi:site-specific recombinase XerD